MEKDEARDYLSSLLNKNLRIVTTDGRLFWGAFKCTDHEMNVILAHTYEYREPSDRAVAEAAEKAMGTKMSMDMTSRYMGLVVIPGQHIVSMSVEEFASQLKGANSGKTIHSRAADNY